MDERTRELVRDRAAARCEYCRLPDAADEWPFHVDHIVARVHGGGDELDNLCWSCTQCNLHKGTNFASIDPATKLRTDLFHPRHDAWQSHFLIDGEGQIVGRTAIGRATIRLLSMNGSPQFELRRELLEKGDY